MRTFVHPKKRWSWAIERRGTVLVTTTGPQGGKVRETTRRLPDEGRARFEHNDLIRKKRTDGYVETTAYPGLPELAPLGRALESAVVEAPDDLASHMAFADWLGEQPEPALAGWGELIRVQLALEDKARPATQRRALKRRERELLRKNKQALLGPLAAFVVDGRTDDLPSYWWDNAEERCRAVFARGWLRELIVRALSEELAAALAGREGRLLSRLLVVGVEPGAWEAFTAAPPLANLRVLEAHADEGIETFIRRLPGLEALILVTNLFDSEGVFGLRNLKQLRWLRATVDSLEQVSAVGRNPAFARLEHLHLSADLDDRGRDFLFCNARALFRSKHLAALKFLALEDGGQDDSAVQEIIRSGILKRLEELDLPGGHITDEGARALAACPDLKRLRRLDLSGNRLTDAGIQALEAVGLPSLITTGQRSGEEEDFYEDDWE
jgi:uncharacterized protein (TIGR02996 family)